MKHTLFIHTVLILMAAFPCPAQNPGTVSGLIKSGYSTETTQYKIDSLLQTLNPQTPPQIRADTYHDLGIKWYYKKWKNTEDKKLLGQAISYTQKAVEIKQKSLKSNRKSLKKSLYNLGYFLSLNNDFFDAIDAYSALIEQGEKDAKTQAAYREMGKAYNIIGDFHKALASFNSIISYYQNDPLNRDRIAVAHKELANTYSLMGFKEYSGEIQSHLKKAVTIIEESGNANHGLMTEINQIEGNRLLWTGEYRKAIEYHKKVLEALPENKTRNLAIVHNSLAFSQLHLMDLESALGNLHKSISYDSNYTDTYNNLGDLYITQKEFEKGLYYYQKAVIYSIDKNRPITFEEILNIKDLALSARKNFLIDHIITQGSAWVRYYQHDKNKKHLLHALKIFSLADQLVDMIRFESSEYQSKLYWREKGSSLYMKAVEVCYLLDKPEDAYYFMEKNKALQLLEDISNEQAKEITKLPGNIAKREFELKRNILLSENELLNYKNSGKATLTLIKEEIESHKRNHERFMDSLISAFPDYAKLKNKVDILPYKNFKERYLTDDEVVIQYILGSRQGYGLMNDAEGTLFFPLKGMDSLHSHIKELYGHLTEVISNPQTLEAYHSVSQEVYRKLIPESVYQKIKGKKLTIIPDHALQQIPFETLVVDKRNLTYLIEEVEVHYAYSMSHLELNKQISRSPQKGLLGFAPVKFETLGLNKLRFSEKEVNEIEKIYGGSIALYQKASKSHFLKAMPHYKIIHLSTHASIGQTGNPWIAFSDDKMSLTEIYATKNQSNMVVLNGCQTSLGKVIKGEGIMSLARGFFHSGTKSVVSSLWSITDQAGKELIVDFYRGLNQGLTKSDALRQAKLKYISTHTGSELSPFYWGGLIVIGDNAGLQPDSFLKRYGAGMLLALLLLAVSAATIYSLKKRKATTTG